MTETTTLTRAIIIHGYLATPRDHWFPWLAEQLTATGVHVRIPELPAPDSPDPVAWQRAVGECLGTPDSGTAVIAHSLGGLAILRHLAALPELWELGALALVAPFAEPLPSLPELDAHIGEGVAVEGIERHLGRLLVIRSDADELVLPCQTDRLARRLGTEPIVVPDAGHFLAADGVTELPPVLGFLTGEG